MRRLVTFVAIIAGIAAVRQWMLARSERELGLAGGVDGNGAAPASPDVTA